MILEDNTQSTASSAIAHTQAAPQEVNIDTGAHVPELLSEIVILLLVAFFAVLLFKRLRLSPVLGYLVAGAAIGEHGIGLTNSADFHFVAEIGIVFLMFVIGQELTFSRLREMRSYIISIGSLQMLITSSVIGLICHKFIGMEPGTAMMVGVAMALSSTAIVLRVLADSNMLSGQTGRLCTAILILQDILVVPLLVLMPELNQPLTSMLAVGVAALFKGFLVLGAMLLVGNRILKPLYDHVAKNNELFVLTTLVIILGSALITLYAELSLAIGAFAAGLMIGGTYHQLRVHETVEPFKDLLMGLFFMTVGMSINAGLIAEKIVVISIVVTSLIVLKASILIAVCRLARIPWSSTLRTGFLLSQCGEFAFIVFSLASSSDIGVLPADQAQILMLIVTITMAVTPLLQPVANALARRMETKEDRSKEFSATLCNESYDLTNHIIIIGFGKTGETVGTMLQRCGVNFVAIDGDSRNVKERAKHGFPVHHGSPYDVQALENLGVSRCRTVIVAVSAAGRPAKIIRTVKRLAPKDVEIISRCRDAAEGEEMVKAGASGVSAEKCENGFRLARVFLEAYGTSNESLLKIEDKIRQNGYTMAETEPTSGVTPAS